MTRPNSEAEVDILRTEVSRLYQAVASLSQQDGEIKRLRDALTRIRYGGKRQRAWLIADAALTGASSMTAEWKPTHRHTKRGTTYVIVGQALLQASEPVSENTILTVYRGENGELWCRPIREFDDGRFEAVAALAKETGQ